MVNVSLARLLRLTCAVHNTRDLTPTRRRRLAQIAAGHDETMDDPVDVGLVVGEYPFVHTVTEAWAMVAHRLIAHTTAGSMTR